ncbi:MAG: hypothetical protein Aureis2KO_05910 [Aureisphaera sp.]
MASFVSCEQEEADSNELQTELNFTVDANAGLGGNNQCCHEEGIFERQLHWLSFLTAEILTDEPSIRSAFALQFNTSSNSTIPAENLIGSNALIPSFDQEFKDRMAAYIDAGGGWPSTNNNPPPIPPVIGGLPDDNGVMLTVLYYQAILTENCVELFLPTSLNLLTVNPEITTTSHPLTTASSNEGRHFYYNALTQSYIWPPTIVNDEYAATNASIIMARPIRTTFEGSPSDPCLYPQYPGIDFTLFLD